MTNELSKTKAIKAPFNGKISWTQVATLGTLATVAAGSILYKYEIMKMESLEYSEDTGSLVTFLGEGATIFFGQIIGYFTPNE